MGLAVFHWQITISTRISVNVCSKLCEKIAKLSCWWRASKTLSSGPVLLLAVCLGIACMRWMGRPQSPSPWQCPWKTKSFRAREEGWSFPAGSKPPDIDLTSPGWEWNWYLGNLEKLSSWFDGGSNHGLFTQTCIHSSAASSASPGQILRLPPTRGLHTSHKGAQPWALPL